MGTHPIFESDFDCLTDMDFRTFSSPGLNSPRGAVPETNGRAVVDALRSLQSKIREMEKSKANFETPRGIRANSIGTDSESVTMTRKISKPEPKFVDSPRSTTSERSASILEAELTQADERCKKLEEKLTQMRLAFVRSEAERNKETEARIRSERERIALTGLYTGSPPSSVGTPRALITTEKTLPVPKLDLESVQLEEDDLQLDEINIRYRSNNSEGEKSSPDQKHKVDLRNIPFCAGRSTQPSHNVGLNIQGLLHQIKTQRNPKSVRKTPLKSSSGETDSCRETDSSDHVTSSSEIASMEELLKDLQHELEEIALSCRENNIPDETLKRRFRMLEKKGQQILVVKKLLKKRHEKSESKSASLRSPKKSYRSSQRSAGSRPAKNRELLREVKKAQSAFTSDENSWR